MSLLVSDNDIFEFFGKFEAELTNIHGEIYALIAETDGHTAETEQQITARSRAIADGSDHHGRFSTADLELIKTFTTIEAKLKYLRAAGHQLRLARTLNRTLYRNDLLSGASLRGASGFIADC
jgi:hypothetical protein